MNLVSFNIRSVHANLKKFLHEFKIFNMNAVGLCETRPRDCTASLYKVETYEVFKQNRSSNGGGVLLYAKTSLGAVKHDQPCVTDQRVESIFIKFKSKNLPGSFYRPPYSSIEIFTENLSSILTISICEHHSSKVFLIGEVNLDLLKIGVNSKYLKYYSLMSSYGYSPYLLRPRRATLTSFTIIVQIWYSSSDQG